VVVICDPTRYQLDKRNALLYKDEKWRKSINTRTATAVTITKNSTTIIILIEAKKQSSIVLLTCEIFL